MSSNCGFPAELRQASEALAAAADIGQTLFQVASSTTIDEALTRLNSRLNQPERRPHAATSLEPPDALVERTLEQMRMKSENENLEREKAEKESALEKERREKEALAVKVARLEELLKSQMASSSSAATDGVANANRDEARKCLDIAACAFIDGDLAKAERFALKTQGMHQSAEVADLLTRIMAAKPKPSSLEDRVAKLELMGDAAVERLIKLERIFAGETQDLKESILSDIQGSGDRSGHQSNKTPRRMMKLYDRLDHDSSSFLQWLFGALVNQSSTAPPPFASRPSPPPFGFGGFGAAPTASFGAAPAPAFGQANPSVVSFVDCLRQNPLLAGSLRSIIADYIPGHSDIVVSIDNHDTQVFSSMNPSNGQGAGPIQVRRQEGSSSTFQSGPYKARFQPKDAWFIRFLERLRDAGLLHDTGSPLGLYNEVIQVDTFNASVRLYFKSA